MVSSVENVERKENDEVKKEEIKSTIKEESVDLKTVEKPKKTNPFLSSTMKDEDTEERESLLVKQHNIIDELANDAIFNKTGKLYFLSKKTNKLETRGSGTFLILKDNSNMYKLTMIRDGVMLKGCNHYIYPKCQLTKATQAQNSWIWTALGDQSDAEVKEDKIIYFARFADKEISDCFEEKYNYAKDENEKILEKEKK